MGRLIGHTTAWRYLIDAYQRGALSHAYLVVGPPGVGKRTLAQEFLQWSLCFAPKAEGSCGTCAVCAHIQAGTETEILLVGPQGEARETTIDQVRNIIEFCKYQAQPGKLRGVIVTEAQTLNREAANALLKILEEPPAGTLLFLLAPSVQAVLPTIRSRCTALYLGMVSSAELEVSLLEKGLTQAEARELSRIAAGRPGLALKLLENDGRKESDEATSLLLAKLLSSQGWSELKAKTAQISSRTDEAEMSFRSTVIDWVRVWEESARDVLLRALDIPQFERYPGRAGKFQPRVSTVNQAGQLLNLIRELRTKLQANSNVQLTLEWFVLNLSRL